MMRYIRGIYTPIYVINLVRLVEGGLCQSVYQGEQENDKIIIS